MHIDTAPEMLAGSKQDRPNGQMQVVNQASTQLLTDSGYSASDANIAATRCGSGQLQSGMNALSDKMKIRAPSHSERRPRVMRQNEDRHVIGWLLAPPAFPAVVRPCAADGAEHVAPKNPGTNSGKALFRNT